MCEYPFYGKKNHYLNGNISWKKKVTGHVLVFQGAYKCASIFIISLSFSLSAFPSSHFLCVDCERKDIVLCHMTQRVYWFVNNAPLIFLTYSL